MREITAVRKSKAAPTPVTDGLSGILGDHYAGKSYRKMKEEMYKDKYGIYQPKNSPFIRLLVRILLIWRMPFNIIQPWGERNGLFYNAEFKGF